MDVKQMKDAILIGLITAILVCVPISIAIDDSVTESNSINDSNENQSLGRYYLDRSGFETNLIIKSPAPDTYRNELPPIGVSEVTYDSGNLTLKAWLSDKPADDVKHPAVVYAHGGFSFGTRSEWAAAQEFANQGFVAMTPMLRAENGNPGNFELYYGEVDDIIASADFLANVSYVDPNRIFLFGHSAGGTVSMLASMMPSKYRAIASLGGSPDQDASFSFGLRSIVPFDLANRKEIELRSPTLYPDSVTKPLFLYVGNRDVSYLAPTEEFARKINESGGTCKMVVVNGDHFSSLGEAIGLSIEEFKKY